ncbi:hypothetical protein PENTCL1PPCAC_5907, partial [Pristionchus entomophagus]
GEMPTDSVTNGLGADSSVILNQADILCFLGREHFDHMIDCRRKSNREGDYWDEKEVVLRKGRETAGHRPHTK